MIQFAINNAFNKSTQSSLLFALIFGFIPRTYDGDPVQDEIQAISNGTCDITKLRARALESIVVEKKKIQNIIVTKIDLEHLLISQVT